MRLYRVKDFPAELCWPSDYLLRARAAVMHETVMQIGNVDRDRIGLGRRTDLNLFDVEKMQADGVHFDRRPFGGAATYVGPQDVIYSFHVSRVGLGDADTPGGVLFRQFMFAIVGAIKVFGIQARVADSRRPSRNDGICVSLEGGDEIVDSEGRKLAGSVYKDDGAVVSIHGVIMVSDAWRQIYKYLKVESPIAAAASLNELNPAINTDDLIQRLCDDLAGPIDYAPHRRLDWQAMNRLEPNFRCDRWQA